jgi:hypothetical protein
MNPRRPRRLFGSASLRSASLASTSVAFLLALSGFGAGCGSSSSGHGDSDNFVGRWEIDPDSDPYTLGKCDDGSQDAQGYLWTEVIFEYGELTDLTETSGTCVSGVVSASGNATTVPGLGYDASGDTAKLPTKDPYTGDAPVCLISLGSDNAGNPVGLQLTPDPGAWVFHLDKAASGQPRRAVFGGGSTPATVLGLDPTSGSPVVLANCTLTGQTTFFRVSKE